MSSTFSGGDKLRRYLSDLAKNRGRTAHVKVGVFQGATYDDGTPVAPVAAVQEFGAAAKNIPARPFFRPTIAEKSDEWAHVMAVHLQNPAMSITDALDRTGSIVADDIKDTIASVTSPPLSASTIKARERKGSQNPTKPLQDTLTLTNAITHQVEDSDGT